MPEQEVQVFGYGSHQLRMVMIDEYPHFVASDISKILYSRDAAMMIRSLNCDEKGKYSLSTRGGTQILSSVNYAGLFRLVSSSKKPEATKFLHYLLYELGPELYKRGLLKAPDYPQVKHADYCLYLIEIVGSGCKFGITSDFSKRIKKHEYDAVNHGKSIGDRFVSRNYPSARSDEANLKRLFKGREYVTGSFTDMLKIVLDTIKTGD